MSIQEFIRQALAPTYGPGSAIINGESVTFEAFKEPSLSVLGQELEGVSVSIKGGQRYALWKPRITMTDVLLIVQRSVG